MIKNRVKDLYTQRKPSLGTYVTLKSPTIVEVCAVAGLDHVRIDAYKHHVSPDHLSSMIYAAYATGLTPWVRCRNDPWLIGQALDSGAMVISTKIGTVEEGRAAIAAVRHPPKGSREPSRAMRYAGMSTADYLRWYEEEVLLSFQLESPAALENYPDIVKLEGVDIIQFGKYGMTAALGHMGEQFHPDNMELEERIVTSALEAGKQVSLLHMVDQDGIARTKRWIERGVYLYCLDVDYWILRRGWQGAVEQLRVD